MSMRPPEAGLNYVPAYQMSGLPYVSGSSVVDDTVSRIEFPFITKFIRIVNTSAPGSDLKVGVTHTGVAGTNFFVVSGGQDSGNIEWRVRDLYLSASGNVEVTVIAGLTGISKNQFGGFSDNPHKSGTISYPGVG